MENTSRRDFLRQGALGLLSGSTGKQIWSADTPAPLYDMLVKDGKVIDPAQKLSAIRDVAIAAGKVVKVAENIPASEARQVLDAKGKIVTPGLIDLHVHVFDGVGAYGIPADPTCIAKGVTTVLDPGSAGAHTFPAFRKHVVNAVETRVFALLNISVVGLATYSKDNPHGELLELRYINPALAARTIEQNRDVLLGVKVRISDIITGDRDLKILAMAKEAADAVKLPLMVHIGDSHSPLRDLLALLGKGDVVTHCFTGKTNGVLDDKGKVRPEVKAAVAKGVHLDVGHGGGSFSFAVAEKALQQDLVPATISSDVHHFSVHGPVFDLPTTLSKFLLLGMPLEQVIERATANPAGLFAFPKGLGTLREGAPADLAVFSLTEGDFLFVDTVGQKRRGKQMLVPVATLKAGKPYGSASIPVPATKGP